MADTQTVSAPQQDTAPKVKKPKHRINYALAATLLSQHVTLEETARQVGAKNGNTLKVGLARRGVTATMARTSEVQTIRAVEVAKKAVAGASEALRRDFSEILASHVNKLKEMPVKPNLKHLRAIGDVTESFVRSSKIVHAWDQDQRDQNVNLGVLVAVQVTAESVSTPPVVVQNPEQTTSSEPIDV